MTKDFKSNLELIGGAIGEITSEPIGGPISEMPGDEVGFQKIAETGIVHLPQGRSQLPCLIALQSNKFGTGAIVLERQAHGVYDFIVDIIFKKNYLDTESSKTIGRYRWRQAAQMPLQHVFIEVPSSSFFHFDFLDNSQSIYELWWRISGVHRGYIRDTILAAIPLFG